MTTALSRISTLHLGHESGNFALAASIQTKVLECSSKPPANSAPMVSQITSTRSPGHWRIRSWWAWQSARTFSVMQWATVIHSVWLFLPESHESHRWRARTGTKNAPTVRSALRDSNQSSRRAFYDPRSVNFFVLSSGARRYSVEPLRDCRRSSCHTSGGCDSCWYREKASDTYLKRRRASGLADLP